MSVCFTENIDEGDECNPHLLQGTESKTCNKTTGCDVTVPETTWKKLKMGDIEHMVFLCSNKLVTSTYQESEMTWTMISLVIWKTSDVV